MPALPTLDNQCYSGLLSRSWSTWTTAFLVLFVWRYLRQVVHLVSFWMYRPDLPLANPTLTPADVTVIVPTVDPHNPYFLKGLLSVCRNNPAKIIIVTVGDAMRAEIDSIIRQSRLRHLE